ncbi:hypothetical protein EJB05_55217 [Eragrostis curvula]|uniref:Uncharacterized protein n=1 Tax=Eragrostis curvula TaxID=38414 RepID=A0A5J9SK74_9POAL|nr:hypothetical protein EJB05_55217 [Eragrostis curvula]
MPMARVWQTEKPSEARATTPRLPSGELKLENGKDGIVFAKRQSAFGTFSPSDYEYFWKSSIFESAMQPLNDITNIITDGNVSLERTPITNMTPFGNQAIFGEGNHGTSTPWQMSILSDSQDNSTRRPLRDITNIVTRGVLQTDSIKRPLRDGTNLRIAGGMENQPVDRHENTGIKRQKNGKML